MTDLQAIEPPAIYRDYLTIGLASRHFDRAAVRRYDLNETNPGVGYVRDYGNHQAVAGVYRNSKRMPSAYLVGAVTPLALGDFKAGAFAGLVSGYRRAVTPTAGLLFTVQRGSYGADITVVPQTLAARANTQGFAALSLRYAIK